MKKLFTVLAAVAFGAFIMTSCSSSDDNNDGGNQPTQPGEATKPAATHTADAKKVTFPEGGDVKEATFDEGGRYDVVLKRELRDQILGANIAARALKEAADDYVHMVGSYTVKNGVYEMDDFGSVKVEETSQEQVQVTIVPNNAEEIVETATVEQPVVELKGLTSDICRSWEIANTKFDYFEYDANGQEKNHVQGSFYNPEEARSLVYMQNWLKEEHDVEIDADFSKKELIKNVSFNQYGTFTINFARESSIGKWNWENENEGKLHYEWEDASMKNDFEKGQANVAMQNGYLVLTLSGEVKEKSNSDRTYRVDIKFVLSEQK